MKYKTIPEYWFTLNNNCAIKYTGINGEVLYRNLRDCKRFREGKCMQHEIASVSGLGQSTVSKVENTPTVTRVNSIYKYLLSLGYEVVDIYALYKPEDGEFKRVELKHLKHMQWRLGLNTVCVSGSIGISPGAYVRTLSDIRDINTAPLDSERMHVSMSRILPLLHALGMILVIATKKEVNKNGYTFQH